MKKDRKEYSKEYMKAYRQSHKEQVKAYLKAYYQAHKKEAKTNKKAYYQAHKEERKAYIEANKEQYNAYQKAYAKSDLNALGQSKNSIRYKSRSILKQMLLKIPGYEIHHCFGYNDPTKFIYISKSLHLKIHQFLRDNNIAADSDHWMQIRDIVNSTDEFTYIKA